MPNCAKCNKLVGKHRLKTVWLIAGENDPKLNYKYGRTFYQCFNCTYPVDGVWTKTREDIERVIGNFLMDVKSSNSSKQIKALVETECLRIIRLPILYPQPSDSFTRMLNAFYHLREQIDVK